MLENKIINKLDIERLGSSAINLTKYKVLKNHSNFINKKLKRIDNWQNKKL